ncbi:unnamed protein product, partial [Rotaria magnacalcarata]
MILLLSRISLLSVERTTTHSLSSTCIVCGPTVASKP